VVAVEFTNMAKHAAVVAERNGVGDVVTVVQGSAEELDLPEKVDAIVSEWMGYLLLRESMLDSLLR
jgi:type I protein arginine methyltransferase